MDLWEHQDVKFTQLFSLADYGQTKPQPKNTDRHSMSEASDHKCLVRATNGKKKMSTVVSLNLTLQWEAKIKTDWTCFKSS